MRLICMPIEFTCARAFPFMLYLLCKILLSRITREGWSMQDNDCVILQIPSESANGHRYQAKGMYLCVISTLYSYW